MKEVNSKNEKYLNESWEQVGKLWLNFLSLECFLRKCIARRKGIPDSEIRKIVKFKFGDIIPLNDFYNCDTLSNVIEKINSLFRDDHIAIDKDYYIRIRNALAHGFTITPNIYPIRLTNLEKYDESNVWVSFSEDITTDYINKINQTIFSEIQRLIGLTANQFNI